MKALFLALVFLVLTGCSRDQRAKIKYDESETEEPKFKATDKVQMLPIHIAGTSLLLHPIGEIENYESRSTYLSESYSGKSIAKLGYSNKTINGNLNNIYFEDTTSGKPKPLTDKNLRISMARYIDSIEGVDIPNTFLYKVYDKDTNKDGNLNSQDVESLYLSLEDGSDFTKITKSEENLIDFKLLAANKRIYYRTYEDSNKDGSFDENDKIHNFYLDLDTKSWQPELFRLLK